MNATWLIAVVTARGLVQRKTLGLFLVLATLLIAARLGLASDEATRMAAGGEGELADAAFSRAAMAMFESAVMVASIFGAVLGLYVFATERRQRTIVAVLVRPVTRLQYAAGKALGIVAPVVGAVLVLALLLVAGLHLAGPGTGAQLWIGLAQVCIKVGCWVAIAVAVGLHLRPGVAFLLAMTAAMLPALRSNSQPFARFVGTTVHALLPAEPPLDLAKHAFSMALVDLDYGLYIAVMAENVLYGVACLAASAALFARRDLDLAAG